MVTSDEGNIPRFDELGNVVNADHLILIEQRDWSDSSVYVPITIG